MEKVSASGRPSDSYGSYLRIGGFSIIFLFLVVIVWGSLARIKGAVIAPGTLIVETKAKMVQHLDGGIVGEILVKDGDRVEQDQILMRLDPTMLEANRQIVETRYFETLARLARLKAERDGIEEIVWPVELSGEPKDTSVSTAMTGQKNLFYARIQAALQTEQRLLRRIEQNRNQISGLRSLIESQQGQLSSLAKEISELKRGVEKGIVSQNRYNGVVRESLRLEGEMRRNLTEISRLNNVIAETEGEISQSKRDREEEVLTELRVAQTDASDFKEQLISAADQRRRIDVLSPSDGVVHNLLVTTIGGVVQPGQEIMQIIPQDDRLLIQAQVQPQDIDQIYEGQIATVRLSAFNQRRTPELSGRVLKLSANSLVDPVTGFPYFSVLVEIPAEEFTRLGDIHLVPGMPAEAFMQTQSRSVLSYFLKPASDAMQRSFREE